MQIRDGWLWGVLVVLGGISCGVVFLTVGSVHGATELAIPTGTPIVLIHGLGGNAEGWIDAGLVNFFTEAGFCYGGELSAGPGGNLVILNPRCDLAESSLFTFQASDSWGSLDLWSQELSVAIREVRQRTGAHRVVLVGFSAGGLAARKYLVDHPEDHGVAELVTVASPHGGSELALASGVARAVEGWEDPYRTYGEEVVTWLEDGVGVRLSSPLVAELMPPKDDNYLARLNSLPLPTNIDYACVLSSGTPGALSPESLRRGLGRIRAGSRDVAPLNKLLTFGMRMLAIGTPNDSTYGDGAVLLASQNLGILPFFEEHLELLREVDVIESDHLASKRHYADIAAAIAGEPELVGVDDRRLDGARYLELTLRDYLPLLTRVEATWGDHRPLAVSAPSGVVRDGEGLVKFRIGPMPEDGPKEVQVLLRPFGGSVPVGMRLDGDGELVSVAEEDEGRYEFSIERVWGLSSHVWDTVGRYPDVEATLYVNDRQVLRSKRFDDLRGVAPIGSLGEFSVRRRFSRVSLELMDVDVANIPESMGVVEWLPGQLPLGRTIVEMQNGIDMELAILPADERSAILWITGWSPPRHH